MTFVNEVVSEEDIQRFDLDEIMRQLNPFSPSWREGRPVGFWHSWIIGHERGIWLIMADTIYEAGSSGRDEPTTKNIFIMDWQGQRIRFLLDRVGRSGVFSDSPFHVKWNLLDMRLKRLNYRSRPCAMLKEALIVYGYRGAYRQVPNTLVTFWF